MLAAASRVAARARHCGRRLRNTRPLLSMSSGFSRVPPLPARACRWPG